MVAITDIELRLIRLPLKRGFRTSFGEETFKEAVLVRVGTSHGAGWGECAAEPEPFYLDEFNEGVWTVLQKFLVPMLLAAPTLSVDTIEQTLRRVRGHRMAKAALEMALLDVELRDRGVSLRDHLGGQRDRVPCGVSVGIEDTPEALLGQVTDFVAAGYRRIKLKIEPGNDVAAVRAVRASFPSLPLSADANGAYTLDTANALAALDQFDLLMIEQPLGYDDLTEHAQLQRRLSTAICLDESITSVAQCEAAIALNACQVVNIKAGRVGGLLPARRIHDVAKRHGIPVWGGGMLETGIGRAAKLALESLSGFTLPGDTSASARYFEEDITPPFEIDKEGFMAVPAGPGLGVEPIPALLNRSTVQSIRITR